MKVTEGFMKTTEYFYECGIGCFIHDGSKMVLKKVLPYVDQDHKSIFGTMYHPDQKNWEIAKVFWSDLFGSDYEISGKKLVSDLIKLKDQVYSKFIDTRKGYDRYVLFDGKYTSLAKNINREKVQYGFYSIQPDSFEPQGVMTCIGRLGNKETLSLLGASIYFSIVLFRMYIQQQEPSANVRLRIEENIQFLIDLSESLDDLDKAKLFNLF